MHFFNFFVTNYNFLFLDNVDEEITLSADDFMENGGRGKMKIKLLKTYIIC